MDLRLTSRQLKALEIADRFRITESHGRWPVPSQSGPGKHQVIIENNIAKCSCPDFEERRLHCKHILAVQFVMNRERAPEPQVTRSVFRLHQRSTYSQPWKAYNLAQTQEQDYFQELLHGLCSGIETRPQVGRGRPTLPLADVIFSAAYKVYSTVSGRRFMSDLRESQKRGLIAKAPHYNSIFNYLENPDLTPLLTDLIIQSSLPLKAVEADFACDSSGFSTSRFVRWFDHKYGADRQEHDWVKVHLMCGVKTNIVTAVEIRGRHANDSQFMPAMVATTAQNFKINEVSADKGYLSQDNARAVRNAGGTPFIAFKSNSNSGQSKGASLAWREMYHYFMFKREEFLAHYHKRSNVETTFSMIKRKFGDSLRSKTDVAMVNEALCKILCHNIVFVIHETFELGIEPVSWARNEAAQSRQPRSLLGKANRHRKPKLCGCHLSSASQYRRDTHWEGLHASAPIKQFTVFR